MIVKVNNTCTIYQSSIAGTARPLSSFRQSPQESLHYYMIHYISLFIYFFKKNTIRSPSIIRVGGKEEKEGKKTIQEKRKRNIKIYSTEKE